MNDSSARDLVSAFSGRGVLIIGDVMLDEYIWGEVRRISPEAPVPVVETRKRTYRPGGAGNVAANIAALGGAPLLCGVTGEDALGEELARALAAEQIAADGLIAAPDRPTTVKSRIIAHSQQMLRLDTETDRPIAPAIEAAILAWCEQQLDRAAVCVLSDYAKGMLTAHVCQAVIALARARRLPIVIDPKGRDYRKYAGATIVTPNTHETAVAVNHTLGAAFDLDEAAGTLVGWLPGTSLLITRGAEGMSLYQAGRARFDIAAHARTVYDVTGAGDTVVAVLALALAAGAPLERAAALANTAAGIVVGKVGTAAATREELLAAIR